MAFDVGDPVYHPGEGVGDVRAILETWYGRVFVIQLRKRNRDLRVPEAQLANRGVRHLIPPSAVNLVYGALRDPEGYGRDTSSWRWQVHCIQNGDPISIACVVGDVARRAGKGLPADERNAYELARSLLTQEIAATRDVDEAVVEREIDAILGT